MESKVMDEGNHSWKLFLDRKGLSLAELLVALVICGVVVGGIYRFFIAQGKAATTQEQVVEVQQNIRSVMELMLRDLRMAGFYHDDNVPVSAPLAFTADSVTVGYEYFDKVTSQYQTHRISYRRDVSSSACSPLNPPCIIRQRTVNNVADPEEPILEYVDQLDLRYGVDANADRAVDTPPPWPDAAAANPFQVIAVQVVMKARPTLTDPDSKGASPRTLESIVTLRNLCLVK